jgi:hypothetical protein
MASRMDRNENGDTGPSRMDWIQNVEKIEDEDGLLLGEFDSEETGELAERIDTFIDQSTANKNDVDKILDIMLNCMKTTVKSIEDTWSTPTVTPEMQKALRNNEGLMHNKVRFLMTIYEKMLDHHRWKLNMTSAIYHNVNMALLAILPMLEAYPHKPKDMRPALLHFRIKSYLSGCASAIWHPLLQDNAMSCLTSRDVPPPKVIPLDLLIPTMRRLGMMDVLEENWSMFGDWNAVFSQGAAPLQKTPADKILQQRSSVWKLARNSMTCRSMPAFPGMNLPTPPQCFRHFSKCTVPACSNIETAQKTHKIRCQKCWYFHCCSPACERYAEMFGQHKCSFTPPDKVALIKSETELHLQLNSSADQQVIDEGKRCNFCMTKNENISSKMMRCGACQSVWYCSRECQQWDWSLGKHKVQCKK